MANDNSSILEAKYNQEIAQLKGKILDLQLELNDINKGSIEEAEKALELAKAIELQKIKELQLQKEILEVKSMAADASQEDKDAAERANQALEKQAKDSKKAIKDQEKKLELQKKEEEKTKFIKTTVLGIVKAEEQRKIKLNDVLKVSESITKEDARATLAAKAKEAALAAGLAILRKIEEGAMAFDSITAKLNQATNTSGKYNSAIVDVSKSNARFGISMQDAATSVTALAQDFSEFSNMGEEARNNLTEFTAKMEKAGISSQATAKFLNTATKSMGMGTDQVVSYQKELFMFARANGISTKQISDGLSSVMPRLAAFGREGPKIFKEMELRAKALGTEAGKLLDVTERFTTFEGAAEAAGNLNSVLGGNYIDTLGLLQAATEDPIKAQDMLRDALQKTGKSFDQLSGSQRRMFAEMLGTDLDTASSFFKKTSVEAKEAAKNEKEFNDAIASFASIGEKLTAVGAKLAPIFEFVATVVGGFVDIIVFLMDLPVIGFFMMAGAVILGLGTAFGAISLAVITFLGHMSLMLTAISGPTGALTMLSGTAVSTAATVGTAGTVIGGAGVEIGAGGTAMAAGSTAAAGGFAGFIATLTPLLPFMAPIAAAIWAIAGAFIAAGLAVALILLGIIGVVLAITNLIKVLIDGGTASLTAAAAFLVISASIYVLAGALGALGTIGSIGVGVLAALSLVLLVIGASFLMVGEGMKNAEQGIKALNDFKISNLEKIRDVLSVMADHMQRLSSAALIFSTAMMNPMIMPLIAIAAATPAKTQTAAISTAGSASTTLQKEQTITANLNIEVPVTFQGKELDRHIIKKVVQLNSNGDSMSNREPAITRGTGLSDNTNKPTSA